MTVHAKYRVGVDIGGTFTDVVVAKNDGQFFRQKAFTTHEHYPQGIIDALQKITNDLSVDLADLMENTETFINGTTIVTNSLAEMRGLRVGLITTAGFKDTLRIARSARWNYPDMQTQLPPPEIVRREDIAEVHERVDLFGEVVVPLDVEETRRVIRHLVEVQQVEAVAVSLLWSFRNPEHEKTIKNLINEMYSDMFVSISSEIYPVMRDYERTVTTVLNCFTARGTSDYLSTLESHLSELGIKVPVGMMQSTGGIISTREARDKPITLLNSGPVGGVVAANSLGKVLGIKDIITADLGGTSFDTSLIKDNQISQQHRAMINRLETGISLVDISTIGAGGGSIAWIDDRGAPQIGPQSAGSTPGPACYGRGGTEPTVTDIAVAMGIIDPDNFLGGEVRLDKEAALKAIAEKIAKPLGVSDIREAIAGLYHIVTSSMPNAVRAVSIEKGYDPREFTMISYGGASGLFIAEICRELGIKKVIIPNNASVFSAFGLLWTEYQRSGLRTVNMFLNKDDIGILNTTFAQLEDNARNQLIEDGFTKDRIRILREVDMKFGTQAYELTIPVENKVLTVEDRQKLSETFSSLYERLYGEGTAWEGAEALTMVVNCRVTAIGETIKPKLEPLHPQTSDIESVHTSTRLVFLPKEETEVAFPVYSIEAMLPGMSGTGPAILEARDTTIYVPRESDFEMDEYANIVITMKGE